LLHYYVLFFVFDCFFTVPGRALIKARDRLWDSYLCQWYPIAGEVFPQDWQVAEGGKFVEAYPYGIQAGGRIGGEGDTMGVHDDFTWQPAGGRGEPSHRITIVLGDYAPGGGVKYVDEDLVILGHHVYRQPVERYPYFLTRAGKGWSFVAYQEGFVIQVVGNRMGKGGRFKRIEENLQKDKG